MKAALGLEEKLRFGSEWGMFSIEGGNRRFGYFFEHVSMEGGRRKDGGVGKIGKVKKWGLRHDKFWGRGLRFKVGSLCGCCSLELHICPHSL